MAHVVAAGLAGLLAFIAACREVFVHKDNNYMRYRQLTGFSMLVMEGIAIALWIASGICAFSAAMVVTSASSLLMIKFYERQLARDERDRELDKSFTKLLIGMAAVLGLTALVLGAVGL